MWRARLIALSAVAVLLVGFIPAASAAAPTISGKATSCSGLESCYFVLNTSAGAGWASTSTYFGDIVSFKLPGESNTTYGGQYTPSVVNVSGTTNHILGTFVAIDANTGKVWFGTTDTNVTATEHCSRTGCSYTYALVNGSIAFQSTKFVGTTTTVSCSPSSFTAGKSTKCTASVKDLANASKKPSGTVTFSTFSSGVGTFSHNGTCKLASGNCTVTFTPFDDASGTIGVEAVFTTHLTFYKSQASLDLYISGG
ncbi:MAG: hypothetical protein L3K17_08125 [Thermoplasmata archaeon]|nr:hypothetical protein [Thermoplasmata archaeon]